ncbi:MAG: hypothetical protein IJZ08_08360 [Clostridia bacterium]|nr:hypothetical protein [Clostridia bacterium]
MQIAFVSPVNGDVLDGADGRFENGSLIVPVKISAPLGAKVTVNEKTAVFADGLYVAEVRLDGYRNTVTARVEIGCESAETSAVLFRFKNARGKYRFAIDDVIWTFKDLAEKEYASVFDQPFMAIFKRLHDDFGTKIQLNLFYEDELSDFNLSMMPDRYKSEFEEAADWLKLTFHGRKNTPSRIYRFAPYQEMYEDYVKITREIVRFAGEKAVQSTVNGIHWGESTRDGARALRAVGIRCLVGSYIFDKNGDPYVAYYLNKEQTAHANTRAFWVDTAEDIIFAQDSIYLNNVPPDKTAPFLDDVKKNPHLSGTINMVTHEQFFYPWYQVYLPDYEERMRAGVRWAQENGYEPAFLDDVIQEEVKVDF